MSVCAVVFFLRFFFFFNDTATTEISPLSLHDALPIFRRRSPADGIALLHELGGPAIHSGRPPGGAGVRPVSAAVPGGGDEGSHAVASKVQQILRVARVPRGRSG